MNPIWKAYKSKMMRTLNPDMEDDPVEQASEEQGEIPPVQSDEGPSAVSQLAKKMQGAGVKSWKSVSALFGRDDEHQLLEAESQPAADHPLAMKPEEPVQAAKHPAAFWDNFATKWHQAAAMRQAEEAAETATEAGGESSKEICDPEEGRVQDGETQEEGAGDVGGSQGGGGSGNSFSKYATLGNEDMPTFKWNFIAGKMAELKSRSMAKSN